MLIELRRSAARKFELAVDAVGAVASTTGAVGALVFGKVLLALVLGVVALGIFLRLVSRRSGHPTARPVRAPLWISLLAGGLSVMECAALVEATDLPVRFSQPGFAYHHWALVLLALAIAFFLQRQVLGRLLQRHVPPAL
jgi:predicted membrane channel-forming protein YqfA (hemolysin III family)